MKFCPKKLSQWIPWDWQAYENGQEWARVAYQKIRTDLPIRVKFGGNGYNGQESIGTTTRSGWIWGYDGAAIIAYRYEP